MLPKAHYHSIPNTDANRAPSFLKPERVRSRLSTKEVGMLVNQGLFKYISYGDDPKFFAICTCLPDCGQLNYYHTLPDLYMLIDTQILELKQKGIEPLPDCSLDDMFSSIGEKE